MTRDGACRGRARNATPPTTVANCLNAKCAHARRQCTTRADTRARSASRARAQNGNRLATMQNTGASELKTRRKPIAKSARARRRRPAVARVGFRASGATCCRDAFNARRAPFARLCANPNALHHQPKRFATTTQTLYNTQTNDQHGKKARMRNKGLFKHRLKKPLFPILAFLPCWSFVWVL